MRRIGLVLAFSVFMTTAVSQSGCYGSFNLTRKLHAWNGGIGSKVVNWLVFVGLVIIPVYGISLIVDAFILNSVEWWTGENPVGYAYQTNDDGSITVTAGEQELMLRGNDRGDIEVLRDGALIGYAELGADGSLTMIDADGNVVRELSAEHMESERAAAQGPSETSANASFTPSGAAR